MPSAAQRRPLAGPYLDLRDAAGGDVFERERLYRTAAVAFVQPMRADSCSERYGLTSTADCELLGLLGGRPDTLLVAPIRGVAWLASTCSTRTSPTTRSRGSSPRR